MNSVRRSSIFALATLAVFCILVLTPGPALAQTGAAPQQHYLPAPMFDTASIDTKADPCTDFYKFACGNFAANHPIPADQSGVDEFYLIYNVNTERLNNILTKFAANDPARTSNQQKIGDFYAACMNTDLIEKKGLTDLQPLLDKIDKVSKSGLAPLSGELQRLNVNVFFGFGEMQDFKDASKQIAVIDQGGLGLPERDYYTRTGDKDKKIREQYVAHVSNILTLAAKLPSRQPPTRQTSSPLRLSWLRLRSPTPSAATLPPSTTWSRSQPLKPASRLCPSTSSLRPCTLHTSQNST
jgi:putative endopeptidase